MAATSEPESDKTDQIGKLSLQRSIRVASRYPSDAARMLSRNFFDLLNGYRRFDAKLKLIFVDYLLQSLHNTNIEREVDEQLLARVSAMPMKRAIRLAARYPEEGMKLLVAIVSKELREHQGMDQFEIIGFVNGFLDSFLSEMKTRQSLTQHVHPAYTPRIQASAFHLSRDGMSGNSPGMAEQ